MKGFITKFVAGSCLSAGLITLLGCTHYRDIVDPCWPERWNSLARNSMRDMYNAQAEKGHILDQTVWNWHFEVDPKTGAATDHLNGAGIETLKYISRRQPIPDYMIFLQTAQDVPYAAGLPPEKLVFERNNLNERRMQAIHNFLATQCAVHGGGAYHIAVHDFPPPSIPGQWTDEAQKNFLKNITSGSLQTFAQPKVN